MTKTSKAKPTRRPSLPKSKPVRSVRVLELIDWDDFDAIAAGSDRWFDTRGASLVLP
jgi:hypothetical protein